MAKINLNRRDNIIVIALGVLILSMFVFLILRETVKQTSDNQAVEEQIVDVGKLIEVADSKVIKVENKTVTLADSWDLNTVYQNSQDAFLKCAVSSHSDCRVYSIVGNNSNFYLSTPTHLREPSDIVITNETKNLNVSGEEKIFTYEKVNVEKREGTEEGGESIKDEETILYFQVYGCILDKVCLNSGKLSLNLEENQAQVKVFEEFVTSLSVE